MKPLADRAVAKKLPAARLARCHRHALWVGESGILVALTMIAAAVIPARREKD
jgi:hypothetical protein